MAKGHPMRHDLLGRRFGRLTVTAFGGIDKTSGEARWKCQCDCGNTATPRATSLVRGHTQSCGCLRRQKAREAKLVHGDSQRRLYKIWRGMKARKEAPVCVEWNDYPAFKQWAFASGYKPDLRLWRIDRSGPYSPDNCRWITIIEQNNTNPNNTILEHRGTRMTLAEWAREMGMDRHTLRQRLCWGWPVEKALTTPVRKHKPYAARKETKHETRQTASD